ncbi:hypothetical protein M569_13016, partial [Genlisea aurea]
TKLLSVEQQPCATESKRFIRKASNPAFIAAQSKFEDLSSAAAAPLRSRSFSSYDSGLKSSSFSKYSSAAADSAISTASKVVQVGGSECGTELSMTSTLDSPDES